MTTMLYIPSYAELWCMTMSELALLLAAPLGMNSCNIQNSILEPERHKLLSDAIG
jgi:hypothetical protein